MPDRTTFGVRPSYEPPTRPVALTFRSTECASGKERYPSQRAAREAMREIKAAIGQGRKKPHRAYECPACGDWHLTSRRRER